MRANRHGAAELNDAAHCVLCYLRPTGEEHARLAGLRVPGSEVFRMGDEFRRTLRNAHDVKRLCGETEATLDRERFEKGRKWLVDYVSPVIDTAAKQLIEDGITLVRSGPASEYREFFGVPTITFNLESLDQKKRGRDVCVFVYNNECNVTVGNINSEVPLPGIPAPLPLERPDRIKEIIHAAIIYYVEQSG